MGAHGDKFIRFHYHPKRMNHPLKRAGERGEDKWEQISWDQALDEIAERPQAIKDEYGPEALVVSEGTYRSDHLWGAHALHQPVRQPRQHHRPRHDLLVLGGHDFNMAMLGWPVETTIPLTASEANTAVGAGRAPVREERRVRPVLAERQGAGRARGEPGKAHRHRPGVRRRGEDRQPVELPIRPGTDLVMMLSWINYIIENQLYDVDFLNNTGATPCSSSARMTACCCAPTR